VSVRAIGLLAPREMRLLLCRGEQCAVLLRGVVADDGIFGGAIALEPVFVDRAGDRVACEGACVLRVDGVGVEGASSAPAPPPVPISFG
jgi:hypothetical protein